MRPGRVALVIAVALAQGACATVSDLRKLENRVARMSGGEVGEQARVQLAELTAEMDRLSREIDELRGAVEVATHRAETAVEEARRAREEADAALRAAPGASLTPPGPAAVADDPPGGTAGLPPIESSPGAVPGGTASEEVARYRAAYGAWRRDEVAACIEGFREFLQTYPTSPYADDALYWMADCYAKQGDYEKAILRFAKVWELHPQGSKAADAMFRQGEILLKLGPGYSAAARDVFQRVMAEYPDSPRADEARRQLERLGAG